MRPTMKARPLPVALAAVTWAGAQTFAAVSQIAARRVQAQSSCCCPWRLRSVNAYCHFWLCHSTWKHGLWHSVMGWQES